MMKQSNVLIIIFLFLIIVQLMDMMSTVIGLGINNVYESNPITVRFIELFGVQEGLALMSIMLFLYIYILHLVIVRNSLLSDRAFKIYIGVISLAISFRAGIVFNNFMIIYHALQ